MSAADAIPFLDRLARELLAQHRAADLHKLTVVLPSRRACHYFKRYLALAHNSPMLAPKVLSMDDYVRSMTGIQMPAQVDLVLLLFEVYNQLQEEGQKASLEEFAALGSAMLSDFNLIDRNLPDERIKPMFAYLDDVKAIDRWAEELGKELELAEDSKARQYLRFWQVLERTYWAFRQRLEKAGMAYAGLAYKLLANSLKARCQAGQVGQTVFAGFNLLTQTEQAIIRQLLEAGLATTFWDMDTYYTGQPMQEAGLFFRQYRQKWLQEPIRGLISRMGQAAQQVRTFQATSYTGQVQIASRLVREFVQSLSKTERDQFPHQANRLAILLPDEALLQPLLHALPDDLKLDYARVLNITMGLNIRHSQLHVWIEQVFDLQEGLINRGTDVLVYHQHLSQILQHSFLLDERLKQVAQQIRSENRVYLQSKELTLMGLPADLMEVLLKPWGLDARAAISGMLRLARWLLEQRQSQLPALEVQFMAAWVRLLRRLEDLLAQAEGLTISTLRKFISELIRHESIPFAGEPIAPIQIMGMLESRALDFDQVIILSCNEGILPHQKHTESVLPFDIRTQFGLYTQREHDAVMAYTFYRLIHRARQVNLVYAPASDQIREPSRLIRQIAEEYAKQPGISLRHVEPSPPLPTTAEPEPPIVKTDALLERLALKLSKGISPSSLNRFLQCPRQFMLETVLKLQEAEEVEEEMDARQFGDLAHEVLDRLFRPHLGQQISPEQIEQLILQDRQLDKLMQESAEKTLGSVGISSGKNYILAQVARELIRQFLRKQAAEGTHRIVALEEFYQDEIPIKLPNGRQITCRIAGKADRIDFVKEKLRVVDYKTGKFEPRDLNAATWQEVLQDGGKGKIVQLLLYKYLLIQTINRHQLPGFTHADDQSIQSGFYFFRNLNQGFQQYSLADEPSDSAAFLEYTRQMVGRMVVRMFDPSQPFGDDPAFGRDDLPAPAE